MSGHAVSVPASQKCRDSRVTQKTAGHLREFCSVLMDYRQLKTVDDIQTAIDESLCYVDFMLLCGWSNSTARCRIGQFTISGGRTYADQWYGAGI